MVPHMPRLPAPAVISLKSCLASAVAAALLVGWATGVAAQTTGDPAVPALPAPSQTSPSQQDSAQPAPPQADESANNDSASNSISNGTFPALPLGHDGVREAQSQLIALGFDPGPADGETGPATIAAAQQYNENRGGSGPVPIDAALLTRLQQDTGPRLTPAQVAARTQPRYQPRASEPSNPLVHALQNFDANLRTLFNGGR